MHAFYKPFPDMPFYEALVQLFTQQGEILQDRLESIENGSGLQANSVIERFDFFFILYSGDHLLDLGEQL